MRCLVVGGTGFLGGAMVDVVSAAGHDTALLSRGRSTRRMPEGVEVIHADRYEALQALEGRAFDWVIDSCAYTPDAVHRLLDAVGERLKRYVMISSISAYGSFAKPGLTERDPVPDASEEDFAIARTIPASERTSAAAHGSAYGPLKRASEIAAAERLGDRTTALRAGLLVGAGDYTDRLTWWARRIDEAHGERRRVPAPAPAGRSVQLIDVRDAADFALRCAERERNGLWNVSGRPMPFADLLDALIRVSRSEAKIVWVDEQRVVQAGVMPWTDLPLMAPLDPEFRYFLDVDTERAQAAGLQCRSLDETLIPLLAWDRGRRYQPLKCGLTSEQEAMLLA